MVRITIIGRQVAPITCHEGSDADAVEKRLIAAFGPGLLKRDEDMVITETLAGDYDFHITGDVFNKEIISVLKSVHDTNVEIVKMLRAGISPIYISPLAKSGTQSPGNKRTVSNPPTVEPTKIPFPHYGLSETQLARHYYCEIRKKVEDANVSNRFSVRDSQFSIIIRDGPTAIYKCSKFGTAPRCLFLELYDCNFIITDWIQKRENGEFEGYDYCGKQSPIEEKL